MYAITLKLGHFVAGLSALIVSAFQYTVVARAVIKKLHISCLQ